MTTVIDIVNDAADLVNLRGQGQTLSGSDATKGVKAFNDMIASWRNEGIDLDLGTLAQSDTVYLDEADILGVTYNAGIYIAHKFDIEPPSWVIKEADEKLKSLKAKYFVLDEAEIPRVLRGTNRYNLRYR